MDIHSLTFLLLTNGISLAGIVLEAAMMIRMKRTRLRDELPMFYAYVVFSIVQGVGLFSIRNYFGFLSPQYFIAFWFLYVVDTTLTFFIIQEIYARALYRYEGLRSLSQMLFRWAFGILVVVAMATALGSPAADTDVMYSAILLLNRSAMIIEFGLVVLLFALARFFALNWRECIFGIAVGLCFYCSLQMVALALRTHHQNVVAELYAVIRPMVGITTTGIWTFYVYRSERARVELTPFRNSNLEEWNSAVLQFLNR